MCRWTCVLALALPFSAAWSETVVPAGTRLSVRLQSTVSSQHSRPGDLISAILIAPVRADGKELLPFGFSIKGDLRDPGPDHKSSDHSVLRLTFGSLLGQANESLRFNARVASVDNARESVDSKGIIHGLRPLRRRPTELEDFLLLAAYAHPAVLASLEFGKFIVAEEEKPRINYGPGNELWLALESPLHIEKIPAPETGHQPPAFPVTPEFLAFVNSLPLRTSTERGVASDLINCIFLGSREALTNAFTRAGWMPAENLTLRTDTMTFFAIASHHSYHEGPVSSLVINGEKPSLVFEKAANTFAKRHHIRIWAQANFKGSPVWIGAGTHDIGIDFSKKARTFSHSVDGNIDEERQKIEDDLIFTGDVSGASLLARSAAPRTFRNATGDQLKTDGQIAAIQFGSEP